MSIFRISEHVPDVYPRKSRDFQLFCAVFDILFGYLKYNIDSIRDITDTTFCNQKLIPLLQTKLGFYSDISIPSEDLRLILKAFPFLVKNKGSLTGITGALKIFLKLTGSDMDYNVSITNKVFNDGSLQKDESYIVNIETSEPLENVRVLEEILKYVIPAGYTIRYTYKSSTDNITPIDYVDDVFILNIAEKSSINSEVKKVLSKEHSNEDTLTGRVSTATIKPIDLFNSSEGE